MQSIWYILLAILGLSVLVITHELGHYLMGKWLGFTITEFSIGLGPKLFGIKGKETEFTLRALPIGGSCRFFGEDGMTDEQEEDDSDESDDPDDAPEKPAEPKPLDARCFNAKPAWKRFLVVLAGPVMNLLTCVVLCFILLIGREVVIDRSAEQDLIIQTVMENGPAEKAGVQAGDVLLAVDGTPVHDLASLNEAVFGADVSGLSLTVLRGAEIEQTETKDGAYTIRQQTIVGGTEQTLQLKNLLDQETGNKLMKVTIAYPARMQKIETYTVGKAARAAVPYSWELGKLVYQSLGMILSGQASCREMTGVVGTVSFVSEEVAKTESASDAAELFLWFMALIAVNLGIVNLFPLPALDGGRLIFILIEMIRRKPVPPEKEGIVHLVGMVLLLALMVALTVSDIMRCFGG